MENQITKRNCNQKEEDEHNDKHRFENFPSEITHNILSRLPITSLIQFSFVRQSWHTLAHDPHLANLQFHQTGKNNPYLIFHREYHIKKKLHFIEFSDDQEDKGIVRKIRTPFSTSMPAFKIIGSCNGLLCLANNSSLNDTLYIYNPFTRKYKELPESEHYQNHTVLLGFGFHSPTNKYKIVKIVYYHQNPSLNRNSRESEVQIYSFSDETWRTIGAVQYQLEPNLSEAVLVGGRLHWVSRPGEYNGAHGRVIISFDLADERFYEVSNSDMVKKGYYCHLTVLRGCLSAFAGGNRKFEIWVMKDYGNKDSWVKEYDILLNFLSSHTLGIKIISGREVRILGLMKNGEILMEYKRRSLVLYDLKRWRLRYLVFNGTPKSFATVVHYGTLNWIDTPLG